MTPTNKAVLTNFASIAQITPGAKANFSNAFGEAFRLLTNSHTIDDTQTRGLSPAVCARSSFYF